MSIGRVLTGGVRADAGSVEESIAGIEAVASVGSITEVVESVSDGFPEGFPTTVARLDEIEEESITTGGTAPREGESTARRGRGR